VLLSEATRALVANALPEGVGIGDLGHYRLKDFDDPQPIHQLVIDGLPSEFPPLKTLETPTNLPQEPTSFVGRKQEVAEVKELLQSSRLVTLTGPGGSGKTRLAVRAASQLMDRFHDGVFFVDLSVANDPDLVAGMIASVVGTGELGPRPVMEMLRLELRHRTELLVIDNFEQVAAAAPVIGSLLAAAPAVRFLVTSRGALHIQGEQEYPVWPLALPDPERLPPPEELPVHRPSRDGRPGVGPGFLGACVGGGVGHDSGRSHRLRSRGGITYLPLIRKRAANRWASDCSVEYGNSAHRSGTFAQLLPK
jgi:hypothetical protein